MKDFVEALEKNPMQGDELSPGIRKIRPVSYTHLTLPTTPYV